MSAILLRSQCFDSEFEKMDILGNVKQTGWYRGLHVGVNILKYFQYMMTSSNGNIFHVIVPLCGEFTGPCEFPAQRPVTRSLGVFFDLRLNKRLSKQPWGWWFETPLCSLWRQCNEYWSFVMWSYWSLVVSLTQKANNVELWCFLWRCAGKAVEQTVKLPAIWDAMTLLWHHCVMKFSREALYDP